MKMVRAECHECGWLFDVVAIPLRLEVAARAMGACSCPICGNRDRNTLDAPRELTDAEAAHKRAFEGNDRLNPPTA